MERFQKYAAALPVKKQANCRNSNGLSELWAKWITCRHLGIDLRQIRNNIQFCDIVEFFEQFIINKSALTRS